MVSLLFVAVTFIGARPVMAQGLGPGVEPGQLMVVGKDGSAGAMCPLEHTSVNADIEGFGARVSVVQTFVNPSTIPIEAVYTFPLPHDAAVDRMRIQVGSRIVDGQIMRREEARRIYDAAKSSGQVAGLLDQERPNIFTQSVANVMPGAKVRVEISYAQILKYEHGEFEFTFPMVVGPRFLGSTPDPEKIFPPITAPGTRTGSTVDLTVHVDAGAPIVAMDSVLHQVNLVRDDISHATVSLLKRKEIPNRDFILHYQTATSSVQSAFFTGYDAKAGGFFDLILLPPKAPKSEDIAPRELMFLEDISGSQTGFPLEKSKELTFKLLETMRPGDTFNVFAFNFTVYPLWKAPRPYTPENLAEAQNFLAGLRAGGGTHLKDAIEATQTLPKDPERLRVILINTDGYVGNEADVLREIKKDRGQTRIFTFGIGNTVNRYLIDAMSLEGKGASEMVTLASSADAAADRFVQRLRSPVLTDVSVSAQGIELTDMVPKEIPDVFSDRPIVVQGRYENPGHGQVVVSGRLGGRPWSQKLNLKFGAEAGDSSVATFWARNKVDELTDKSFEQQFIQDDSSPVGHPSQVGQDEANPIDYRSQIVDVALQFGIMTQYTSFVAVEPRVVNVGGALQTVHVPVEMASGVAYEGIFGRSSSGPVAAGDRAATSLSANGFSTAGGAGIGGAGGGFGGAGGGQAFGGAAVAGGGRSRTAIKSAQSTGTIMLNQRLAKQPADLRTFESVVDKRLRLKVGKVSVMIFLNNVDPETVAKLKKLGISIDVTDSKLMMVFGTCDASVLRKLVDVTEADRVAPLE